jgi:hypothetical protein
LFFHRKSHFIGISRIFERSLSVSIPAFPG